MSIGKRITTYRKELGLSQEGLADAIGVSRQSIYNWETGASVPDLSNLIELAKLFNTDINEMAGLEVSKNSLRLQSDNNKSYHKKLIFVLACLVVINLFQFVNIVGLKEINQELINQVITLNNPNGSVVWPSPNENPFFSRDFTFKYFDFDKKEMYYDFDLSINSTVDEDHVYLIINKEKIEVQKGASGRYAHEVSFDFNAHRLDISVHIERAGSENIVYYETVVKNLFEQEFTRLQTTYFADNYPNKNDIGFSLAPQYIEKGLEEGVDPDFLFGDKKSLTVVQEDFSINERYIVSNVRATLSGNGREKVASKIPIRSKDSLPLEFRFKDIGIDLIEGDIVSLEYTVDHKHTVTYDIGEVVIKNGKATVVPIYDSATLFK